MCGRVPCPERRYIATSYALSDGDNDGGGVSRARSAARAFSRREASISALSASTRAWTASSAATLASSSALSASDAARDAAALSCCRNDSSWARLAALGLADPQSRGHDE